MFLTHPLPRFMMFTGLEMALSHMILAWAWAVPCSVRASSGCHVFSARVLGNIQGANAEGRGLRVWHGTQSQRKFLPCYPRRVKTEPTQHILGISKGILGLLAFLNKREVWSWETLMNQYSLVMLELLSKAL